MQLFANAHSYARRVRHRLPRIEQLPVSDTRCMAKTVSLHVGHLNQSLQAVPTCLSSLCSNHAVQGCEELDHHKTSILLCWFQRALALYDFVTAQHTAHHTVKGRNECSFFWLLKYYSLTRRERVLTLVRSHTRQIIPQLRMRPASDPAFPAPRLSLVRPSR